MMYYDQIGGYRYGDGDKGRGDIEPCTEYSVEQVAILYISFYERLG